GARLVSGAPKRREKRRDERRDDWLYVVATSGSYVRETFIRGHKVASRAFRAQDLGLKIPRRQRHASSILASGTSTLGTTPVRGAIRAARALRSRLRFPPASTTYHASTTVRDAHRSRAVRQHDARRRTQTP